MPGSNAGTGQPIWFACYRHRLGKNQARYWNSTSELAAQHRVTLTGRKRKRSRGGVRMSKFFREYQCSCGHVGWSGHSDLERMESAKS